MGRCLRLIMAVIRCLLTTPITLLAEDRLGLHPLPDYCARSGLLPPGQDGSPHTKTAAEHLSVLGRLQFISRFEHGFVTPGFEG
jgi:hypothetical protein